MTWVRLDDSFPENPKIAALSDTALALWVTGLAYCNRNLTDGFIPTAVGIGQLRYCDGNAVPAIRELEAIGLWTTVDNGWEVHDYPDYQPSRAQVEQERANKQAAGRAGGLARAKARAQAEPQAESKPVPVPVPDSEPITAEGKTAAPIGAAVDNPGQVSNDWQYLLGQLLGKGWDGLSFGALKKLECEYGHASVDSALREAHGYSDAPPLRAFPYLESICVRIAEAS